MKRSCRLSAVVAITPSSGIGNCGTLPWGNLIPGDLSYFRKATKLTLDPLKQNACIMGRKTWLGIPEKNRPLKGRINIILTKDLEWARMNLPCNVFIASSLDMAMSILENDPNLEGKVETAVVIGGKVLFEECLLHPACDTYHVTRVNTDFECDTYLSTQTTICLDSLTPIWTSESTEENGINYRFLSHGQSKILDKY